MLNYGQIQRVINATFASQLRGLAHNCELRRDTQSYDTATSSVAFSTEVIARFKATIATPKTEILRRTGDHLGQSGGVVGVYQAFIDPTTIVDTNMTTATNKWLLTQLVVNSKLYSAASEYVIKEVQPIPNSVAVIVIRLALYSG